MLGWIGANMQRVSETLAVSLVRIDGGEKRIDRNEKRLDANEERDDEQETELRGLDGRVTILEQRGPRR